MKQDLKADDLTSHKDVFTLINIGGATVIPKDGFIIDRNKLEERDSGQLTVFTTREERFEPFDLAIIEVGTEQETTFSSLGANNLIVNDFTSVDASFGGNTIFLFNSTNTIPSGVERLYIQLEWNQNFTFNRFGVKSRIAFLDSQEGQLSEVNFEDIFENEVYGNATIDVPENAASFLIQMVSVSTNPQGLQFQALFLNSNETAFVVSVEDITVKSFQQMLVQSDTVIKNRDGLFEHQLQLIEVIAKFDGFYPADRIVSSTPPKTLGEVLDIYRNELELYHNLDINWNRQAAWTNTLVRQKEFVGVNFSVILQDLFRAIDAIPRAVFENDVWFIFPDFINERKNLIEPNPVQEILEQDNLDYATRIKTQIKNGTYESSKDRFFPSIAGHVLPKGEGPQKIDSKLEYQLDSNILDITQALVVDVNIADTDVGGLGERYDIDITKHVLPKPFWDGQKAPVNQTEKGVHKKNSLFFDIGTRSVKNLFNAGTDTLLFFWPDDTNVLRNAILTSAIEQELIADKNFDKFIVTPFQQIKMRFRYIPQRNIDIVHHRQFLKNMNEITQTHRQRDSQVEIERYKNTLKNLSNRMGNDIKQYIQVFTDTEPFDLGDYDLNNNVVVRVKNTFYNDYILSEFIMAEGFGNIDGETSLWKEPSAFDIQEKDITTNIIIEEFVEISRTSKSVNTRLTPVAQKSLIATLDNGITPEPPVQGSVMRPVLAVETAVSTNGLYLPVLTGGGGNTTSFHIHIPDQIRAGRAFSDTLEDENIGEDIIYTYQEDDFLGDFGELRDFRFYLVSDVTFEDEGFYPLIDSDDVSSFENAALTQTNIIDTINKDKNAKFAVTFQQHIVTDDPDIIIGAAFAKYNRLFTERTLPNKKIYASDKPFSIFDDKVRSGDSVIGSSWTVDENERKLTFTATTGNHIALTYNGEIIIAINNFEVGTHDLFINFVSEAERTVINQLSTPALVSSTTTPNSIQVVIQNTDDEPAELSVNLFGTGTTQTESVGAGGTATFTFTSLTPNRIYNVNAKALPVAPSEKVESAAGVYQVSTQILPTVVPVFSENSVELQTGNRYDAKYNVANNNDFPVEVFARVDGFEYSIGTLAANASDVLIVDLSDDNQFIFENISHTIDMRFRTTTQQNNWFSSYTDTATLLISKLETPTFVSSSATDVSTTWVWRNESNRTVQIEMDLFAELQGINVFIEKKTGSVLAGLTSTQTFTGLDPETTYKTTAKALQVGFRLESDLSGFSPTRTTLPPTTAQPSFTLDNRTENRLDFTFTNNDGATVDIYWNLTGNPTANDNVISNVGSGLTGSASATGLDAGTIYVIHWRAKAANKLISSQGQSTNQTLLQLQSPNFGFASTTFNSINSQWGNPNNEPAVMEARLQIAAQLVEIKTVNIPANGDASVEFTGLGANTSYNIAAKFLADDFKVESATVNSGVITTPMLPTEAPSIINVNKTHNSVSFTLVNNDSEQVFIEWGLGAFTNSQNLTTQTTTGFSNLDPETQYTIQARATGTNRAVSQTVTVSFTTDPTPQTATPTITIPSGDITSSSAKLEFTNNDADTVDFISYTVTLASGGPPVATGSVTNVDSNDTKDATITGLNPNTEYRVVANAQATGKLVSESDEAFFTTAT